MSEERIHIVHGDIDGIAEETNQYLKNGWQIYGELTTHSAQEEGKQFIYGVLVLVKYVDN